MAEQVRPPAEQPLLGNIVGNLFGIGAPAAPAVAPAAPAQPDNNINRLRADLARVGAPAAPAAPGAAPDEQPPIEERLARLREPGHVADPNIVALYEAVAAAENVRQADPAALNANPAPLAGAVHGLADAQAAVLGEVRLLAREVAEERRLAAERAAAAAAAVVENRGVAQQILGLARDNLNRVDEVLGIARDMRGILNQFRQGGYLSAVTAFLRSEIFMLILSALSRPLMPQTVTFGMSVWFNAIVIDRLVDFVRFRPAARKPLISTEFSFSSLLYNITVSPLNILMSIYLVLQLYKKVEIENPSEFNRLFPGVVEAFAYTQLSAVLTGIPIFSRKPTSTVPPTTSTNITNTTETVPPTTSTNITNTTETVREPIIPVPLPPESLLPPHVGASNRIFVRTYGLERSAVIGPNEEERQFIIDCLHAGYSDEQISSLLAGEFRTAKLNGEAIKWIRNTAGSASEVLKEVAPEFWKTFWDFIGSENKAHFILALNQIIFIALMRAVISTGEHVASGGGIPESLKVQAYDHFMNSIPGWILMLLKQMIYPSAPSQSPPAKGGQDEQMQIQLTKPLVKKDTIRDSILRSLHTVGSHRVLHQFAEQFSGGEYKLDKNLKKSTDDTIMAGILLDNAYSSKPTYTFEFLDKFKDDDISAQILGGNPKSKKKRTYKRGKPSNRKTQLRRRRLLVGKRDAQV